MPLPSTYSEKKGRVQGGTTEQGEGAVPALRLVKLQAPSSEKEAVSKILPPLEGNCNPENEYEEAPIWATGTEPVTAPPILSVPVDGLPVKETTTDAVKKSSAALNGVPLSLHAEILLRLTLLITQETGGAQAVEVWLPNPE